MSNYKDVTASSISQYSGNKCLDAVQMTFLNYRASGMKSVFISAADKQSGGEWELQLPPALACPSSCALSSLDQLTEHK